MSKPRILLSLITHDNDYQREQASVAEATAHRLGVELHVVYADGDAIKQTQQLMAALRSEADRPTAVLVEPVGTAMPQIARTAVANGVAWLLLNRESEDAMALRATSKVPIGSVFTDNVEVGRIQGRQFAALLPGGGRMMYVEGPAADVAKERRAGMQETLPANIEVMTIRGKWTEESAFKALSSRLQLQGRMGPNVQLIGCQNDAMAMGARKAIEALPASPQREQWLQLPFTGVDGVSTSGQQWVQKGLLMATVITPALTGLAMELVMKALSTGTQLDARTLSTPVSYPPLEKLKPLAPTTAH